MAYKELRINIDEDILDKSEELLSELGLGVQSYVRMALVKLVRERRIPFDLSAGSNHAPTFLTSSGVEPTSPIRDTHGRRSVTREMRKITTQMCEFLWNEFKRRYVSGNRNYKEAARLVSEKTGMNDSSAFIYFNILGNMLDGVTNKRTLKFEDLEFFTEKIIAEFPANTLKSVIKSLELSVPYWRTMVPGNFADKVLMLIDRLKKIVEG